MRIFHELPVHQINYFGILKPVPLELSTLFMESYVLFMFCLIQCRKASYKLSCIFAFTCSRNANSPSLPILSFPMTRRGFTTRLKRLQPRAPILGAPQNFGNKDNFQHFCK